MWSYDIGVTVAATVGATVGATLAAAGGVSEVGC